MKLKFLILVFLQLAVCSLAEAREFGIFRQVAQHVERATAESTTVHHAGDIEVAFSPGAGAEQLVVKVIHTAKSSIRLAGYSFTSKLIAAALVDAKRRGIDVMVVLDKSQKTERYSGATFIANAGIPVRIDSNYAIFHHKFVIVDSDTVQQGSFNYTTSAAARNAENAMVVWHNPQLAAIFQRKWQGYWNESQPYAARY